MEIERVYRNLSWNGVHLRIIAAMSLGNLKRAEVTPSKNIFHPFDLKVILKGDETPKEEGGARGIDCRLDHGRVSFLTFHRCTRKRCTLPAPRPKNAASKDAYYREVSESVFQSHVIQCARENGFVLPPVDPASKTRHRRQLFTLVYHTYSSLRSAPGFPDLVMVHPETGRTIIAELKAEGKYPTPEQRRWLDAFRKNPGLEVYVWRPSQMQEIAKILGGRDSRLFV
jgi:hypothetical protein